MDKYQYKKMNDIECPTNNYEKLFELITSHVKHNQDLVGLSGSQTFFVLRAFHTILNNGDYEF